MTHGTSYVTHIIDITFSSKYTEKNNNKKIKQKMGEKIKVVYSTNNLWHCVQDVEVVDSYFDMALWKDPYVQRCPLKYQLTCSVRSEKTVKLLRQ